jgi:hypothetical protein
MTAGGTHLHLPDGSCRSVRPESAESLVGTVLSGRASFPGTRGRFLRAPAACWWARQEVESTLAMDQSMRPAASASAWTARRILSHVPSPTSVCVVRRRSSTCRNVQADPARALRSAPGRGIPSITLRWLFQRPPRWPVLGKCGFSRAHSSFVRSARPTTGATTPARTSHMIRRTGPR